MRAKIGQDGFTLIEMIVVIVIMAMASGLVLVKQPWHSPGLNTEATMRALVNGLRLARSLAIAQDREVSVVTAANGFAVDGRSSWVCRRKRRSAHPRWFSCRTADQPAAQSFLLPASGE